MIESLVAKPDLKHEDRAYVDYIEKKCHTFTMSGGNRWNHEHKIDNYHEIKLTDDDLVRLAKIIRENEVFVLPTTTAFGFAPAFMVCEASVAYLNVPSEITTLAMFAERQLPDGWTFDRIAKECFPDKRQTEFYGLRFTTRRVDYDY